jgi:hypothetical protein
MFSCFTPVAPAIVTQVGAGHKRKLQAQNSALAAGISAALTFLVKKITN